jgi:hypothetical protein
MIRLAEYPRRDNQEDNVLRTNESRLVELSIQGKPTNPATRGLMVADAEGIPIALPGTGGITYNVKIGDPAFGWAGDHVEPGVSTVADEKDRMGTVNTGFNFYACIGNDALLVSGDAKGQKGTVTGHHGGAEHVLIDFPDAALKKMTLDDKILIHALGQGLELLDYPEIKVYNVDPRLLRRMAIKEDRKKGLIFVPVTHRVPGRLMGSGVGSIRPQMGDYDIMTQDAVENDKVGLTTLCFGDIVAIMDHDNTYGRNWLTGAVTIGVVIHSDCRYSGHGPGVVTLMSCKTPKIVPVIEKNANIGRYLKIGIFRPKTRTK